MIIATSRISMTEITETCGHGVENCVTHGPFQSNIRLAPKLHCNPGFTARKVTSVSRTLKSGQDYGLANTSICMPSAAARSRG